YLTPICCSHFVDKTMWNAPGEKHQDATLGIIFTGGADGALRSISAKSRYSTELATKKWEMCTRSSCCNI
ncbi:hypothetical protein, partial [Methylomonas lenta]|uniref:hypothetical protein n=1 Tax=Methylomonas lenta TaxID=980561 RepID=UPI001E42EAE9